MEQIKLKNIIQHYKNKKFLNIKDIYSKDA